MANEDRANQNANNRKSEGERWSSEPDSVEKRPRRANQSDPTAERTADQSTQSASGLGPVRPGPGPELADDIVEGNDDGLYETPRRYESSEE